ncbi:hypothetical protein WME99_17610 [Sorangium sp. So ce136]|uniref:hypothetical protein n=1 Tax=Sorangium sp. So ce136 TaxID=3133284 RepID=UPI003F075004
MDFAIMSNVDRMGHGSREFPIGGVLRPRATRDSAATSERRACDPADARAGGREGRLRRSRRASKATCELDKSWTGRLMLV